MQSSTFACLWCNKQLGFKTKAGLFDQPLHKVEDRSDEYMSIRHSINDRVLLKFHEQEELYKEEGDKIITSVLHLTERPKKRKKWSDATQTEKEQCVKVAIAKYAGIEYQVQKDLTHVEQLLKKAERGDLELANEEAQGAEVRRLILQDQLESAQAALEKLRSAEAQYYEVWHISI